MATYSLNIFSLSTVMTNPPGVLTQSDSGDAWNWHFPPPTMTISPDASTQVQTAEILDTDPDGVGPFQSSTTLDDDSGSNQTLTSPLTLDGKTYPAGSEIQDEYEISLTGSDGQTYRLAAISVREFIDPFGNYNDVIIGYAWDGAEPPDGMTLTYVSSSAGDYQSLAPCFAAGTLIATPEGPHLVEELRAGESVLTSGRGPQVLRWTGERLLTAAVLAAVPNTIPIRIRAGALGQGLPESDLIVSPQHRILVRSPVARRMAGMEEVLIAAKHLTALPGIASAPDLTEVRYCHLLFDAHEILFANGAETESLFLGDQLPHLLDTRAQQEISALFPDLQSTRMAPARLILKGRFGRKLAERHLRNGKPLLSGKTEIRMEED